MQTLKLQKISAFSVGFITTLNLNSGILGWRLFLRKPDQIGLRLMASIQFSQGIDEEVVPDVRLTRSREGNNGTATFYFENPNALRNDSTEEITGMYLVDEEGELVTREVKAKFVNGRPEALEATYLMKSAEEWDRFMRFMERYAEQNGLGFSKS